MCVTSAYSIGLVRFPSFPSGRVESIFDFNVSRDRTRSTECACVWHWTHFRYVFCPILCALCIDSRRCTCRRFSHFLFLLVCLCVACNVIVLWTVRKSFSRGQPRVGRRKKLPTHYTYLATLRPDRRYQILQQIEQTFFFPSDFVWISRSPKRWRHGRQ